MSFEWYQPTPINTPISQGDIIFNCHLPKIIEKDSSPFFKLSGEIRDVIIVTQACDLENDKIDEVKLCPFISLTEVVNGLMIQDLDATARSNFNYNQLTNKQKDKKTSIVQKLKAGNYLDFHVINKYENQAKPLLNIGYKVVLLKETYTMPKKSLEKYLNHRNEERLRLQPPYREHLSQAFARNFFRIGLPIDLVIDPTAV